MYDTALIISSIKFQWTTETSVYGGKYSIYQCVQATIEWSAVCLSEYRQLKPSTTSTLVKLPLFVDTFSYNPKHTHIHIHHTTYIYFLELKPAKCTLCKIFIFWLTFWIYNLNGNIYKIHDTCVWYFKNHHVVY